jgi:membrane fusion protein, multidrug efflux system
VAVDVRKGVFEGDTMEITGSLKAGDMVVRRASDETREGAPIQAEAKRQ